MTMSRVALKIVLKSLQDADAQAVYCARHPGVTQPTADAIWRIQGRLKALEDEIAVRLQKLEEAA